MVKINNICKTIKESFSVLFTHAIEIWKDYKIVEQNNDPVLEKEIFKSNIYRILPFSILVFFLYFINFWAELFFAKNNSHIWLTGITVFLLGIGTLFLIINVSPIIKKGKIEDVKKAQSLYYGFLIMITFSILIFTYINIIKRNDLNNYFIFLTIMALYPLAKRKKIILFTLLPSILVLLIIFTSKGAIILVSQVIVSYVLCIFISQTLYTAFKKNKMSEKKLSEINESLLSQVGKDCLTKLLNRNGLQEKLNVLCLKAISEKKFVSTLLIDIDFFKDFNDTFGHQRGDECLINVAQTIEKTVKNNTDIVCRYGGEEFLVFLYDIGASETIQIGKQIIQNVEELHLEAANKNVSDFVTISMGISRLIPQSEEDITIAIRKADEELYRAKNKGRNCIGANNYKLT